MSNINPNGPITNAILKVVTLHSHGITAEDIAKEIKLDALAGSSLSNVALIDKVRAMGKENYLLGETVKGVPFYRLARKGTDTYKTYRLEKEREAKEAQDGPYKPE